MQVIALIHEENGRYGVSFPDFPGATTVAGSADAALVKAAEVIAFHVEGLAEDGPVRQPRTLDELRADPGFRADARGAMIAVVPYAPPSQAVRVNITIDESLLDRIDRDAEYCGQTRSGWLAEAAKARLGAGMQGFSEPRLQEFTHAPPVRNAAGGAMRSKKAIRKNTRRSARKRGHR